MGLTDIRYDREKYHQPKISSVLTNLTRYYLSLTRLAQLEMKVSLLIDDLLICCILQSFVTVTGSEPSRNQLRLRCGPSTERNGTVEGRFVVCERGRMLRARVWAIEL